MSVTKEDQAKMSPLDYLAKTNHPDLATAQGYMESHKNMGTDQYSGCAQKLGTDQEYGEQQYEGEAFSDTDQLENVQNNEISTKEERKR